MLPTNGEFDAVRTHGSLILPEFLQLLVVVRALASWRLGQTIVIDKTMEVLRDPCVIDVRAVEVTLTFYMRLWKVRLKLISGF